MFLPELTHNSLRNSCTNRAEYSEKGRFRRTNAKKSKFGTMRYGENGLNIIPGGYIGLKCVHHFAARTGYTLPKELAADTIESVLVDVQRHSFQHMDYYLDEYTFRFNRRTSGSRGKLFYRLIEQAAEIGSVVYNKIMDRKGA